eukprot:TRINITY_DN2117_c0_g1_i1.p1 TRINITY_DN2117_c0_g1~~TRINITY_DN2117_c0_g1_i1.p1  ORF type:complete len:598 (-),score=89.12 TRINITY_DN2117_c0_g1_i1:167-1960(-)
MASFFSAETLARTKFEHFDPQDPEMKKEIIAIIAQYLEDEGYGISLLTLFDEAGVKDEVERSFLHQAQRLKKSIMEGEWLEVDSICQKKGMRDHKGLLYAVYRQQFMELVHTGEVQKAFSHLTKKLKPLEKSDPTEFLELCYLLTCKTGREAEVFRSWGPSVTDSRMELCKRVDSIVKTSTSAANFGDSRIPPSRLVNLLHQAVSHQVNTARQKPGHTPIVKSLIEDACCLVVPNTMVGVIPTTSTGSLKTAIFFGQDDSHILTGQSDGVLRMYNLNDTISTFGKTLYSQFEQTNYPDPDPVAYQKLLKRHISDDPPLKESRVFEPSSPLPQPVLPHKNKDAPFVQQIHAHKNRIWSMSAFSDGEHVVTAGADGEAKVIRISQEGAEIESVMQGHTRDIYSIALHPSQTYAATCGHDKTVRLYDVKTSAVIRSFQGHTAAVTEVTFNPHGNLLISGSKDKTVRFWDLLSGECTNVMTSHLSPISSIAASKCGSNLVTSARDNSIRLWDLRTLKQKQRYKGVHNTSLSFARVNFGPGDQSVISGCEDGSVSIWDKTSGDRLARLTGHRAAVYNCLWSNHHSYLLTSSQDATAALWGLK